MSSHPETPEAAALALLRMIMEEDKETGRMRNEPSRRYILDLYAECLIAASGNRFEAAGSALH